MVALSYLVAGDRVAAVELLKSSHLANPGDVQVENDLAFCQMIDEPDMARLRFERLAAMGHVPLLTTANLAGCALLLGDDDLASSLISQVVRLGADGCGDRFWLWDLSVEQPHVVLVESAGVGAFLSAQQGSLRKGVAGD